jgi:hypothetical protein
VFVCCFSLLMRHLLAWSIHVNIIALHSVKRVISVSTTFKYNETKMHKTGEFLQKNCYAYHHKPSHCVFTVLGCYLSLNAEALETSERATEQLFINSGSQFKIAAKRYAYHIHKMGVCYHNQIRHYLHLSHFNSHGVMKGSGIPQ